MSSHRDNLDFMSLRRTEDESKPMSAWARRNLELGNWFSCCSLQNGRGEKVSQIRIPPTEEPQRNVFAGIRHAFHFQFHDLIVWQINTSYSQFFAYALLWYLIWVNVFTAIIYGAVEGAWAAGIECITTFAFDDSLASDLHQNMEYAFELSWTTFSTVGYGAISPSGGNAGCYWIRYICAIEAFIGVIYFGFCGAIFFAKITRILARAPVTFSSSLCVQYDTRFSGDNNHSTEKKNERKRVSKIVTKSENSFPVLEFRVVNDKANVEGWEILEAAINCMVSIDISKDEMPTNDGERRLIHASSNICDSPTGSSSELFSFDLGADETNHHMRNVPVSKQVFHKLDMEAESHPYFKRVWYCRHVLNEQSPLLTGEMRSKIVRNGGNWPSYVNTHEEVRSAIVNFNTIIITLKGTLNRTSSDIFIEKRYNYEDLCVGYKFAGLFFLKEQKGTRKKMKEQKVQVDRALVHDIVPQPDGGAEPLINKEKYVAAACDSPKFVSVV